MPRQARLLQKPVTEADGSIEDLLTFKLLGQFLCSQVHGQVLLIPHRTGRRHLKALELEKCVSATAAANCSHLVAPVATTTAGTLVAFMMDRNRWR